MSKNPDGLIAIVVGLIPFIFFGITAIFPVFGLILSGLGLWLGLRSSGTSGTVAVVIGAGGFLYILSLLVIR